MKLTRLYRWLLATAVIVSLLVVVLGAYVRISDAGLGCPDWPGCYGHLTVASAVRHVERIEANFPDSPLHPAKAFKEMLHRYVAGTLGLLVLVVAALAWRQRRGAVLPPLLVGLIVFQALLGMWTVTLRLEPMVVTAHLLGGMTVLALLWWLLLDTFPPQVPFREAPRLRPFAVTGLVLLAGQILLGGWTSAHYAGLACSGFPACNGHWWPSADYLAAFSTRQIDGAGLVAIHWIHRLGAFALLLYLGVLSIGCIHAVPALRRIGQMLGLLLLLQIAIGISNVLTGLPLPLAAAHNAGAALLLLTLVTLNHRLDNAAGGASTGEPP